MVEEVPRVEEAHQVGGVMMGCPKTFYHSEINTHRQKSGPPKQQTHIKTVHHSEVNTHRQKTQPPTPIVTA